MRHNLLKKNSTKAERVVYEILKELHIPFRHRWKVNNREIDFLVGNLAIEIDGHDQNSDKNLSLLSEYKVLHLSNNEVKNNREKIKTTIKELYDYKS